MIDTYEVEWRGPMEGEGVWGAVEEGGGRGKIYILLNGQTIESMAEGRKISELDRGGYSSCSTYKDQHSKCL